MISSDRWRELRRWFAESGTARLVLASGDEPVPWVDDPLQDWVRMPVHLGEAQARLEALTRKVADRRRVATVPQLDGNGRLFHGGRWVCYPEDQLWPGSGPERR